MKKPYLLITLACAMTSLIVTGCKKKTGGVWDDNHTSSNYTGGRSLWGNDDENSDDGFLEPTQEDFIALQDDDLKSQFIDGAVPQPHRSPGEPGSGLPGVDQFFTPKGELAQIFRTLHFNTDDHILRGKESLMAIDKMAEHLKKHPNLYVFVSGFCDERGPEAYNLSLGARRANYVRTLLVQRGIDLNRIHTISYGKEKPVDVRHNAEAWSLNRRAEFKLYER